MPTESEFIIKSIIGREILDSRGNPAVESQVCTNSGITAIASAPSGASKGRHEAFELRDMQNINRFLGKGVLTAVSNINKKISSLLKGVSCNNQSQIDKLMLDADGTKDIHILGANSTTAVSIACAKAAAKVKRVPLYQHISDIFTNSNNSSFKLPVPLMNIINGGMHSGSNLSIQEFMIIPVGCDKFYDALRIGTEVYHNLGAILSDTLGKPSSNVGDEGGYAPAIHSMHSESALSFITKAVDKSGYKMENDIMIGIDCAANNFWDSEKSKYMVDGNSLNSEKLLDYYRSLCEQYPIKVLEDPFREDDVESFKIINKELGNKIFIVGDDLYVTNEARIRDGILEHLSNSIIIKVNQVGTLTEASKAVKSASSQSWGIIASHRSGETNDDWLSDFAVGIRSEAIKAGAPARGERVAKYNRLSAIEQMESSFDSKSSFKSNRIFKI